MTNSPQPPFRIIYHPAPGPAADGTPVIPEPVMLGSNMARAATWIRRRLGIPPDRPLSLPMFSSEPLDLSASIEPPVQVIAAGTTVKRAFPDEFEETKPRAPRVDVGLSPRTSYVRPRQSRIEENEADASEARETHRSRFSGGMSAVRRATADPFVPSDDDLTIDDLFEN